MAQPSQPKPITAPPIAVFPYADLPHKERQTRQVATLIELAQQQQHTAFLDKIAILQQTQQFSPQLQTALARGLQSKHCTLLLAITPVEISPERTSAYSQLAAAFCSKQEPQRAAAHFAAVNQLHQQANEPIDSIALRGEGEALMAAGKTEQAMQRWHQLLHHASDAALGKILASLALQHPQFKISALIAKDFPHYFPAGQLALQQARLAQVNGDMANAERLFQQSLTENPDATVWYELALLHQRAKQTEPQGAALAQAVRLAPDNALFQAEYGFWLIGIQRHTDALQHLQTALRLDPTRIELQPQIAILHVQLGHREEAITDLRASIDQAPAIQAQMGMTGDAAAQQLFNWQRNVQILEDRWSWTINTQVRLNDGPDVSNATSPIQYGQYNGAVDFEAAYRLNPLLDPSRPTWLFARASQGLEDRSLQRGDYHPTVGLGVRQRLLKDHNVIASAEWLRYKEAKNPDDIMLRLSGSHSINSDWQPIGSQWLSTNVYGDAAWVALAESYYLTAAFEAGLQYRLAWLEGKSTVMPYVSSIATANNHNASHTVVSRVDIGAGIALQTWHGADPWRAPDLRQRISLEARHAIGGNSDDHFAVLLRWGLFH